MAVDLPGFFDECQLPWNGSFCKKSDCVLSGGNGDGKLFTIMFPVGQSECRSRLHGTAGRKLRSRLFTDIRRDSRAAVKLPFFETDPARG